MRKVFLAVLLLTTSVFAQQISGAGTLGCNAAPVTGTVWSSATSLNTTQVLASNIAGAEALVTLDQTSTLTVGAVTFQGDPGDGTFVNLAAWQVVDPTAAPFAIIGNPYTLQATTNKQFLVYMAGMYKLQLKLTTAITGTATVTPFTTLVCYHAPQLSFQATAANLSANIGQWGGTNVLTGTGTGGAGAPRVTVSSDSSLAANQSTNVAQFNGVTPLMNNGVSGTGSQRVNIASDNSAIANWGLGATGSAVPTGAQYVGGIGSANLTGITVCDNTTAVSMSTATTTQIIAISGTGGRTYICGINLLTAAANNVALVSGSGANCASNLAGLAGGTTAATGWNFAANGGLTWGNGIGVIFKTVVTNNEICLITSAATQLSGTISWTQY